MRRLSKNTLYQVCGLAVPLLTFFSPSWISIAGVSPRWAELWLLPWALEQGPLAGGLGGFCLGILLDAMNLHGTTQIPSLILIGYWWGRVGRKEEYIYKNFTLGFLAWVGALVNGLFIWLQQIFALKEGVLFVFNAWAFHTVLAGSILTGLIAPLLCPLIMRAFFKGRA